jgi:hypothetical protein
MRKNIVLPVLTLVLLLISCGFLTAQSWPKNSGGVWVFYHSSGPNDPTPAYNLVATLAQSSNIQALKTRLQEYKNRGAEYIRLWIPWSAVQLSDNVNDWDFSHINTIISAIVSKGFKLDIQLCTQMYPNWYIAKINSNPKQYLHCYKDGSVIRPETALGSDHSLSDKKVQSPPLSIWSSEALTRTRTFITKSFENCLNAWAPHILYVRISLGRYNEPNYPDKERFWHHDPHARSHFASEYPGVPFPEDPTALATKADRTRFIKWYRTSKQTWIKRIFWSLNNSINNLPGNQKIIIYVAGSGDVYDMHKNEEKNFYYKYTDEGWLNRQSGDKLDAEQKILKHMEDNRWIFWYCQQHNNNDPNLWFVQYAGVGETVGPNTGCTKMMQFAADMGYTGPVYGQIPTLTNPSTQTLIDFNNVQRNLCENGYWGFSWNKDSDLTDDDSSTKLLHWNKLQKIWSSAKPGPPSLISPINNTVTNTFMPVFVWANLWANPSVLEYQLRLYHNNGSTIIYPTLVGNGTNWQSNVRLSCNTGYYWQLRARNWCGWSNWSTGDFVTPGIPRAPGVIKPTNNQVTNTKKPVFRWNAAVSKRPIIRYEIKIRKSGGRTVVNTILGNVTRYDMPFRLDPNKEYYWRIRAENECGWSNWSPRAYFRTPQ